MLKLGDKNVCYVQISPRSSAVSFQMIIDAEHVCIYAQKMGVCRFVIFKYSIFLDDLFL